MAMRIVIIGSNIAGMTAAIELKERLGDEHRVVVISQTDQFLFTPSLIWVPFGLRDHKDVTFPLVPVYRKKGIEFHDAPVTRIDLAGRKVFTPISEHAYDYLVIATGPKLDAGNTGIVMTADHLLEPRDHAWLIPGPEAHWAKLAFEKYFLATHRHGHV
jgi:sulfide:quinone oxidoreductase